MRTENIILENLIYNSEYASTVGIFLKEEYFKDQAEKVVFSEIQKHITEFHKPPTAESLSVKLSNRTDLNESLFNNCSELLQTFKQKTDDEKWLIQETEKWAKDQAVYNGIVQSISILEGKDKKMSKDAIPDILTEALAVSLDKSVGHHYIDNAEERWEFYNRDESKLSFGSLSMLDLITNGGITPKTLTVLLGGTGVGKTLVKTHFTCEYLKQGYNVLYITLEMAEERIAERIDANLMGMNLDEVSKDRFVFTSKIDKFKNQNFGQLVIKEFPTASAHVGHFRTLLRELKIKKNFKPAVIVIDYLNICSSSRMKWTANMNTYIFIKSIAEEIRGLAVEENVPIITSSQLNREGFQSTDPGLANTSESFGLPATADLMLAITTKQNVKEDLLQFKQLKNRYSDISINTRFVVNIHRSQMKLIDKPKNDQPKLADDGTDKYYVKNAEATSPSNAYVFTTKPKTRDKSKYEVKIGDWNI